MTSARKVAALMATVTTSLGVLAALPATADAAAAKQPSITVQGSNYFSPGNILRDTIRSYGTFGDKGHLGCSLFRHVAGNPTLHNLHPNPTYYPRKDNTQFLEKDHDLNPNRKYYYKVRCGTPFRTVAAGSAYPTKPVNG